MKIDENFKVIVISSEPHESPKDSEGSENSELSLINKINYQLITELGDLFSLPESAVQKVRQILLRNGFEIPSMINLDPMGEELIISLEETDNLHGTVSNNPLYLYMIFYLTNEKIYDVYAEIINETEMENILNDLDNDDDKDEDSESN